MTEENHNEESKPKVPKWIKRIGKMMIVFTILGCILLALGSYIFMAAIDNALSGHGF